MKAQLKRKIESIRANPCRRDFILADARDADMAWGVESFGTVWPPPDEGHARYRTQAEFLSEIRKVVEQGIVDILLASVSVMDRLAHQERLFDNANVTPAIRANDTTDIWCVNAGQATAQLLPCPSPARLFRKFRMVH